MEYYENQIIKAFEQLPGPRPEYFILGGDDGHQVIPTSSVLEWGRMLEDTPRRIVKQSLILRHVYVSTVFIGFNYNFFNNGPPIVFETMIFDDTPTPLRREGRKLIKPARPTHGLDVGTIRYCTWEEAARGHEEVVSMLRVALGVLLPAKTGA